MKRILSIITIVATLCLSLCGYASDSRMKAQMQAMIGINKEIKGTYDRALAVNVNNGTYVGELDGNIISFKGIPYAAAPIGKLRWKSPILAENRKGVYEAKYFGKSPIQTEAPTELGSYYLQGEDCLTLNVWTNKSGPKNGKTVMVFFHGGGYGWGATSDPMYDGHNLVEKYPDLILVTVEYRTGIMGFIDFSKVPGGDNFTTSGNLGLLDQICALKWIQKNIKAFGGNPDNVTIFGESAGGGSVSLIPLINGTKGLFKRIIAESGAPNLTYSKEDCQELTRMLLKKSGRSTMDELMTLSEEKLIELNEDLNENINFPERDGVVLPNDLYKAWGNKALADIDIMVGTNNDELRYWIREWDFIDPDLPKGTMYKQIIPLRYKAILNAMTEKEKKLANTFMNRQIGRKIWKITEFFNELIFRIPALEQAVRHKGTSYNYYFTMPSEDKMMKASHAVELAYVFRNPHVKTYNGNLYNNELADVVQDMWVNFARSGNPSTEQYTWKPYTVDSRNTMLLGKKIGMTKDLKAKQRKLVEPLLYHYFNGNR